MKVFRVFSIAVFAVTFLVTCSWFYVMITESSDLAPIVSLFEGTLCLVGIALNLFSIISPFTGESEGLATGWIFWLLSLTCTLAGLGILAGLSSNEFIELLTYPFVR